MRLCCSRSLPVPSACYELLLAMLMITVRHDVNTAGTRVMMETT